MNTEVPTKSKAVLAADAKSRAYDDIRRKIVHLELAPGEDLDEGQLVRSYGLSRTPIREILIRLAGEGLVVIRRNRGAYVAPLNVETLQAVFEAGDFFERAIIRLACERRTKKDIDTIEAHMRAYEKAVDKRDADAMVAENSAFHESFAIAARNKYLLGSYRPILVDHERIGQLWYARNLEIDDDANQEIISHHRKLFDALVAGDGARGEEAAIEHADFCKDGVRAYLSVGDGILRDIILKPQPF